MKVKPIFLILLVAALIFAIVAVSLKKAGVLPFTFVAQAADFSVRFPGGWKPQPPKRPRNWIFRKEYEAEKGIIELNFHPSRDAPGALAPGFEDATIADFKARSPDTVVESVSAASVGGLPASRILCSHREGDKHFRALLVVVYRRNVGMYVLELATSSDRWSEYEPEFQKVVDSFRAPAE